MFLTMPSTLKLVPQFSTAIVSQPSTPVLEILKQASAFHQKGQLEQAQSLCEQVLRIQPESFEALHLSGVISAQTNDPHKAVDLIGKAIALKPESAVAHNNLGNALRALARYDAAIQSYERAIALNPDYAEAYSNRGNALVGLTQYEVAIQSFDRAILLKPDFAAAYYNRGNALQDLNQHAAAIQSFDRAIALKPDFAEAYNNRGRALQELNHPDAAIESLHRAIALSPAYAEAHWNLGLCYLQLGNYDEGWKQYEWRWRKKHFTSPKRNFKQPQWCGEDALQGKTILLHGEQGLGDTIQFCRYAKLVADLGARVVLEVAQPLLPLLRNLAGVSNVVVTGGVLPPFDYHCPLLSLPLAFRTTLSTIPCADRYLTASTTKAQEWQTRLGPEARPRVGLVISGNDKHENDHNRSIPLSEFAPVLSTQLQFILLQKDLREADRKFLESRPDIVFPGDKLNDFMDTAALCELVDVVVSVDTSVAHLAGALGRPVWILLPFNSDWRWLLDRSDSPWYFNAKLLRQERMGDWDGVIRKVNSDFNCLAKIRCRKAISDAER